MKKRVFTLALALALCLGQAPIAATAADYERVKRVFDPEEVERAVEDAKRREAQEREQKKAKRKFDRGAR